MTTPLLTPGQLKEMRVRIGVRLCTWCGVWMDNDDNPIDEPDDMPAALVTPTICTPCIRRLKEQYANTTQEELNEH